MDALPAVHYHRLRSVEVVLEDIAHLEPVLDGAVDIFEVVRVASGAASRIPAASSTASPSCSSTSCATDSATRSWAIVFALISTSRTHGRFQ